MKRRSAILLSALLLAGCAGLPETPPGSRNLLRDFALEARFALRVNTPDQAVRSSSGRLSWEHKNRNDHVLLANPLGIGLAEIEITPAHASLRTADGKLYESDDPDKLIEAVTGESLPATHLPAWLLGRPGTASNLDTDALGRPARLREAGWVVDYAYSNDTPDALPVQLNIMRNGSIELKLRIESWRETP